MPKLLQSIVSVLDIFYQYASQDEECDMLNKAELKELLEKEFHQILKVGARVWTEGPSGALLHPLYLRQTPGGSPCLLGRTGLSTGLG